MDAAPPPAPIPESYHECVVAASAWYRVPPEIVVTLLMVEGGRPGMANHNANGSWDLGPMQINTVHLDLFAEHGISRAQLRNDACVNIAAGTYLLATHLRDHPDEPWRAVGDYHSATPRHHRRYLRLVRDAYVRLQGRYEQYVRWLRAATFRRLR